MFAKRHYQKLAKVLLRNCPAIEDDIPNASADFLGFRQGRRLQQRLTLQRLVEVLQEDNPSFNSGQFIKAAGGFQS